MFEKKRHEYIVDLNKSLWQMSPPRHPGARVRADMVTGRSSLADLMLSTYEGTIDHDGESLDDARAEIDKYLDDTELTPLLNCSWIFFAGSRLVSACLVSWWDSRRCPIIGYVITDPDWKNRGIAAELLQETLHSLLEHSYTLVRAVITEGNIPSERLFTRASFIRTYPEKEIPTVSILEKEDSVVPPTESSQVEFSEA